MKHSTLFGLLGSLTISACASAAHAPRASVDIAVRCTGPVTIQRQADVRAVATTCGAIEGDLRVVGTDVTNLDGLEHIRSVSYLVIAENPRLENVRGLRGLVSVRGITLMNNPALTSLEGLEGVQVKQAGTSTTVAAAPAAHTDG